MTSIEIPWVEKYRPLTFDEIVSQNIAVNNLKKFVKSGDMPHMIFTGPAGTGKTSTALIIAKHMLKPENYYRNLLELNASDTVRMDYVRTVIKDFVNQSLIASEDSLKFIILDEADNIPNQVQQTLRRIIEKASTNVKFILMCNYINGIIDPIISRCAVFRFVNLTREKIIERLKFIAKKEKIKISQEEERGFYETLFFISGGDLRKAINTLQMAVSLELLDNLNNDEILRISGFLDQESLDKFIKLVEQRDLGGISELLHASENFDSRNFLRQLIEIIPNFNIDEKQIVALISYAGDIDYRISQGGDEIVQTSSLFAEIVKNIKF